MDFISVCTEILRQEKVLTSRQKDIIDTGNEVLKFPFDRNTAIQQARKNSMNYPELAVGVFVTSALMRCPLEQMTNSEVLKILQLQIKALIAKKIDANEEVKIDIFFITLRQQKLVETASFNELFSALWKKW